MISENASNDEGNEDEVKNSKREKALNNDNNEHNKNTEEEDFDQTVQKYIDLNNAWE